MNLYRQLRVRAQESQEQGFTLIELLIVIVVLGVLAGIVVFAVGGINDNSTASACKSDKKNVEIATETYYTQQNPHAYPDAATSAARINQLVGAKVLREAPSNSGYTITLAADGTVTADNC